MKRFLLQQIDRILIVLAVLLLILLSIKTLNNLATLLAVEAPQELQLDAGDLVALYTLNSGMNKPAILNRRGDALVEFSGWNSYISVDGVTADLWTHSWNIELDRARRRAFFTWSSAPLRQSDPQARRVRRYHLQQVTTLDGPRALVEYYIVPNDPVNQVRLTVGLYGWYLRGLRQDSQGFFFLRSDLNREAAERRELPRRVTRVYVRALLPPQDVHVLSNHFGAYALEVTFAALTPSVYRRTPLAALEVTAAGDL